MFNYDTKFEVLPTNKGQSRQPISAETYDALAAELHELRRKIIAAKRPTYTQASENCVRNFQQGADLVPGVSPGQVLAIYLGKQIVSIMNILADPSVQDSEKETRFADAMNYIEIAYVMWKENALGN